MLERFSMSETGLQHINVVSMTSSFREKNTSGRGATAGPAPTIFLIGLLLLRLRVKAAPLRSSVRSQGEPDFYFFAATAEIQHRKPSALQTRRGFAFITLINTDLQM